MRLRAFAPILALACTLSFAAASCSERGAVPADAATSASANPAEAQAPAKAVAAAPVPAGLDPMERDPKVVLAGWAEALERRDWAEARRYWGDAAQSPQDFARAWNVYRSLEVEMKEGVQEGAAGSLYYTAPVAVRAVRQDGAAVALAGEVVLRRANDVPGATPRQLRWHIERSTLQP